MRRAFVFSSLLVSVTCQAAANPDASPNMVEHVPALDGTAIARHMRTLSSDDFLGRAPGQVGGDIAADYVAERYAEYGLEAPSGSYFQTVPMVGTTTNPATVSLSFSGPNAFVTPRYLTEFVLNAGDPVANGAGDDAELVFAGYGIDASENAWNDFSGGRRCGQVHHDLGQRSARAARGAGSVRWPGDDLLRTVDLQV